MQYYYGIDILVAKRQWITDKEFVELLAISQSLPGLNATNMAILVGDKLRGVAGSIAAIFAICLPGALLMYGAGIAYQAHGDRPLATAALRGVAAAAVGLVLATAVQLGKKSLSQYYDLIFVAITILGGQLASSIGAAGPDRSWFDGHRLVSSPQPDKSGIIAMSQLPSLIRVFAYLSLLTWGVVWRPSPN